MNTLREHLTRGPFRGFVAWLLVFGSIGFSYYQGHSKAKELEGTAARLRHTAVQTQRSLHAARVAEKEICFVREARVEQKRVQLERTLEFLKKVPADQRGTQLNQAIARGVRNQRLDLKADVVPPYCYNQHFLKRPKKK